MEYFHTRAGHRLAYSSYGPEDGAPIILLHGGGQTRHAWQGSARVLAQAGWRAISVDLRGHGDSDWPGNYQIRQFADDVIELAQSLQREPVLVGASLGGLASLIANGGDSGEISRALILVDIAPRLRADGVDRILGFMAAHRDGFASLEDAAAAVAAYQPQRSQRSNPDGLKKNLRQRSDGRWYWHWDPKMLEDFQRGREESDVHDDERFYTAAEKLSQPVLLVRGSHSDVIDESITAEFRQRIPGSKVVDVSGAGHMVAGDQNDLFVDAVKDFIGQL
ncbi:alpha/beta fold hydrolase [Alcanivorax sp. 1008]|uniref:alpha/beta fold hydrolase n=1 Tax=Alcanivorax sp. 1008 TaxID=2816853 RepID=UPI001DB71A28|nr:alpha/beta hydrolase [Alcanivorax sp. 1008]MCC1497010.1 alpha/beta hydrolase [Alcanivorax sp. 1008]